MKKITLFLLGFFFSLLSKGQDAAAVHYSKLLSPDSIYKSLEVLASDSLEGRETGLRGQKKAARFIAGQFAADNLLPGSHATFFQHHTLNQNTTRFANIEVNQQFFLFGKDFFYIPGYNDTTLVVDSVLFLGYGISDPSYDDCNGVDISEKTILFYEGEPQRKNGKYKITKSKKPSEWSTDPEMKLKSIEAKKPRLIFIITNNLFSIADSFMYGARTNQYIHNTAGSTPVIFITPQMALRFFPETNEDRLMRTKAKIDKSGRPAGFLSSSSAIVKLTKDTSPLHGENIIGIIEGSTKKDEYVFLTAHYDHLGIQDSSIYPGADDNASGTSAVIEMARIFSQAKKEGHTPLRTLVFMTVSGEEKGLLGSKYYTAHPLFPLNQTVADLNIDMIGRTDAKYDSLGKKDYIYIIGSNKLSSELHQINEAANEKVGLTLDYYYNRPGDPNRFYFRSDHYNFVKNNIPVIFYFNGVHEDYHKPGDTLDKIDAPLIARRASLVFLTAWELANRDQRIRVDLKNDMEK